MVVIQLPQAEWEHHGVGVVLGRLKHQRKKEG